MRFKFYKTSDLFEEHDFYTEVDTLEELLTLIKAEGRAFFIFYDKLSLEWCLEIYDAYRE